MNGIEAMATTEELAAFLKLQPQTIRSWRSKGGGPQFHTLGNKVRYDMAEVREWLKSKRDPNYVRPIDVREVQRLLEEMGQCRTTSDRVNPTAVTEYMCRVVDCGHHGFDQQDWPGGSVTRCSRCGATTDFILMVEGQSYVMCGGQQAA